MKKILFLTSTNLASNPRLVKELHLAISAGYIFTVIQFRLGNWSDRETLNLEKEFATSSFVTLSALRRPFFSWLISSLLQNIFKRFPLLFINDKMLSISIDKRSFILLKKLFSLKNNFDWVIAHNPGTFYPAYVFAKSHKISLGIDVEDYHPGETNQIKDQRRMLFLMQAVLPHADYCSFAAPIIATKILKNIPSLKRSPLVVMNGFPVNEFILPQSSFKQKVRLVWFSQNINAGRGLEEVIPVINELCQYVELHLIGALNFSFDKKYLPKKDSIFLYPPMPQKDLHVFLSTFDVGLAADLPININRDIALTNKLFVYSQAGLFIAAMRTEAQQKFLKESGLDYVLMEPNRDSVRSVLLALYEKKQKNEFDKYQQYTAARKYSWEVISTPLLHMWETK